MKEYIGTKIINAIPEVKNDQHGYAVFYPDGYRSWSPKDVFEASYKALDSDSLTFGDALVLLEQGLRLSRKGWNGKGQFIFLVPGSTFTVNRPPLLGIYPEGTSINYHGHVDIKSADGTIVPWIASQTDAQAKDWGVFDPHPEDETLCNVVGDPFDMKMSAARVGKDGPVEWPVGKSTRLSQIPLDDLHTLYDKVCAQAVMAMPGTLSRKNLDEAAEIIARSLL